MENILTRGVSIPAPTNYSHPWVNVLNRSFDYGVRSMQTDFYENILNNLFDGVYYLDRERKIIFWNQAAARITGYSKAEVVGSKCSANILNHIDEDGNELCENSCPVTASMAERKLHEADVYLHHKNGHRVPVSVRVTPVTDDENEVVGAVEIFSDSSQRIDTLTELELLRNEILIDGLTGVGNRTVAELILGAYLQQLRFNDAPFGVLFLDIDFFKLVNDTFGRDVGDHVLKMVSGTISSLMRPSDMVARWGGEEFLIIVPNIGKKILAELGERVRSFVEQSWIIVHGHKLAVTVSIGGTMARTEDDIDSIIKRVDAHMYLSKEAGRNRISICN